MVDETGLTQQEAVRLTFETQAVANLMRDGTAALRSMKYTSKSSDIVWALLSLGTEKLLKLTLGLALLETKGDWPGKEIRGYGHGVLALDATVRGVLRERVHLSAQPALAGAALAALDADEIWPLLVVGLDRYGRGGRYHHLDWVSAEPEFESPLAHWNTIEGKVHSQRPDLLTLFVSTAPGDFELARQRTNDAIEDSVQLWWHTIHTQWSHGAIGQLARSLSSDINPKHVITS